MKYLLPPDTIYTGGSISWDMANGSGGSNHDTGLGTRYNGLSTYPKRDRLGEPIPELEEEITHSLYRKIKVTNIWENGSEM